jgi:serine/threonine protein kinase
MSDMVGALMGRYELLEPMATGGMAELYLARSRRMAGFEKLVVLKRILPHFARDSEFVDMFLNEARLAATLDHPNVVGVMDFGDAAGDYFLTMEYVHGADLNQLLGLAEETRRMPLEVALSIVCGVCAGLHYAHEKAGSDGRPLRLVHRDVSPSNVLVSYDGAIKVTDFGIATATARTRATQAGTLKGKCGYMSPEQCKGAAVDRRSDVFALGIMLYETTLLHRAFTAEHEYAAMNKIITGDLEHPSMVRPGYPAELETIVLRALALEPSERFGTAQALQQALEAFALRYRLRLSPLVVAAWMKKVLGLRPYPTFAPSTDAPPASRPVETISALPPTRVGRARPVHRPRWPVIAAGGAVALAATLAWVSSTRSMDRDEPIVEQAGSAAPPIEVLVVPTPALDANQGQITNSSSRDAGAHEADEALDPSTKPTDLVITDLDIEADDVPSKRRRRTRTGKRAGSTQKGQSGYDLDDVLPPR